MRLMKMTINERVEFIAEYRKRLAKDIDRLMEVSGHDFEETQFILESALDMAITDKRNEIYE